MFVLILMGALGVFGGYAAFDPSPPAIMIVVTPAKMIVAPQQIVTKKVMQVFEGKRSMIRILPNA